MIQNPLLQVLLSATAEQITFLRLKKLGKEASAEISCQVDEQNTPVYINGIDCELNTGLSTTLFVSTCFWFASCARLQNNPRGSPRSFAKTFAFPGKFIGSLVLGPCSHVFSRTCMVKRNPLNNKDGKPSLFVLSSPHICTVWNLFHFLAAEFILTPTPSDNECKYLKVLPENVPSH